jgi:ferrochelatase
MPWLEPDINDHLREIAAQGVRDVIVAPIGFISDHLEVLFDLDVEAQQTAQGLGMTLVRAGTVGTHPAFVAMVRELIAERLVAGAPRRTVGRFGPNPDVCPVDCCLPGSGRPSPWAAGEVSR